MRILLSRSSTNQVIGGAELSSRDIVLALLGQKQECLLLTNIRDSEYLRPIPKKAVRHTIWARYTHSKFSKIAYPVLLCGMFFQYFFITLRYKPTIIHPQSREDQIILTFIGRLLNIPVVWRDPGDLLHQLSRTPQNYIQKANRSLQIRSLKKATHIITLNQEEFNKTLRYAPFLKEKVTVIPSNILFSSYDTAAVKIQPYTPSSLVLGTVVRLEEHKGIQYLIEAFGVVQSSLKKTPLELWIVGDGSYRHELEKQAKAFNNIYFFGNDPDVSKYFTSFDIFIQPAEFEGWGRNVKEAMYFSLPVVGSAVGGIKKQIRDGVNGLLFQPKNSHDLAAKLEHLINHPKQRKQLGVQALKDVQEAGDWNRSVQEVILPLFHSFTSKK